MENMSKNIYINEEKLKNIKNKQIIQLFKIATNNFKYNMHVSYIQKIKWLYENIDIIGALENNLDKIKNYFNNFNDDKKNIKKINSIRRNIQVCKLVIGQYLTAINIKYNFNEKKTMEQWITDIPNLDNETLNFLLKIDMVMEKDNKALITRKSAIKELLIVIDKLNIKNVLSEKIDRNDFIYLLQEIENNTSRIKTRGSAYNAKNISCKTKHILCAINILIRSNILVTVSKFKPIMQNEIKTKMNIPKLIRDYYTDEEQEKLSNIDKTTLERFIFTIFLTTGLRCGAVTTLRVKNLYDNNMNPLEIGNAMEKNNKIRKFNIFPPLKQVLIEYHREFSYLLISPECYIFPANRVKSESCHASVFYISNIIKKVAKRANVSLECAHPHALRKTVISNLMNAGNKLDDVSRFIGHSSTSVTANHYWVSFQEDLIKSMDMSTLLNYGKIETNVKNDECESSFRSYRTCQLNYISKEISEGIKDGFIIDFAKKLMSNEQKNKFEKLWSIEAKEYVAKQAQNVLSAIADAITERSFLTSSNNYNDDDD